MYRKPILPIVIIATAGLLYLAWAWNHVLVSEPQTIEVQRGSSLHGLAVQLQKQEILHHRSAFVLLARLRGDARNIKPGEYRVEPGLSAWQLLDRIVEGKVVQRRLGLIEGWSFRQFRAALDQADRLEHLTTSLTDKEIMAKLGLPDSHPEGWFFPDTYQYSLGVSDLDILARAHDRMKTELDRAWATRAANIPLTNAYEVLILASIVEKETGQPQERPMISGVFTNRLRKKMRLQTDPTVIYGMGDSYIGNIRKKDLLRDTPYNTYTRSGLPPTPIAMPGAGALTAAVNPAETKALYFVARGDGSHVFSDTLKQHNDAVLHFQIRSRTRNYRSAPGEPGHTDKN
ncbi:MAG: endolytic transglycosylase MltG [Gammaproteobacteria bacterium]|nr:endolytic transglycosylase MltG [Gammaproteobacteria bacterium]